MLGSVPISCRVVCSSSLNASFKCSSKKNIGWTWPSFKGLEDAPRQGNMYSGAALTGFIPLRNFQSSTYIFSDIFCSKWKCHLIDKTGYKDSVKSELKNCKFTARRCIACSRTMLLNFRHWLEKLDGPFRRIMSKGSATFFPCSIGYPIAQLELPCTWRLDSGLKYARCLLVEES